MLLPWKSISGASKTPVINSPVGGMPANIDNVDIFWLLLLTLLCVLQL